MTRFAALLRAVNVGGTGKLPMSDLKTLCEDAGFSNVRTYIASGNVVFSSAKAERIIKATLEASLAAYAGKSVGVLVRSAGELAKVLAENPFANMPSNKTMVFFLDEPPAANFADVARGRAGELLAAGRREIYVHYPDGMGQSKLKIPAVSAGTARNVNTVAKLAELARA
jgi:uncharacterized protein (DUF1697 family)